MKGIFYTIGLMTAALILSGAAAAQGTGSAVNVDYETDIQPIFDNSCLSAGCHTSAAQSSFNGLSLDPSESYAELTGAGTTDNAPLVIPGNADMSKLIWKLEGVDDQGISVFGARMPRTGPPYLSDSTIAVVRQWIDEGAVLTGVGSERSLPGGFSLAQNYPNPFNPWTTIGYRVEKRSRVRLMVFNILGREVATLVDRVMPAGEHTVAFDAGNLPSGIYFYTLAAGGGKETKKLVLMK